MTSDKRKEGQFIYNSNWKRNDLVKMANMDSGVKLVQ